jgi:tetratricopeptide (TPR) repeat protein
VRSTFDDALSHFADGSIDLMHIDGLHTYDAVRHDFDSWRPKLSENAVVMLHDTNVRERGFGVFRLWAEIATGRPHFEFLHGHGLGIVATGRAPTPALEALFEAGEREFGREEVRAIFAYLGQALQHRCDAKQAVERARAATRQQVEAIHAAIETALPVGLDATRDELKAAADIARFRNILAANSEDRGALVGLSMALNRVNRVTEAIDVIQRAIALHPDAGPYGHLGNLHARLGNWPAAVAAMKEAAARAPNLPAFQEKLKQFETKLEEQAKPDIRQ